MTTESTKEHVRGAGPGGARVGSPISNEAYDVLTALQNKLEGLEAYRKYQRDGGHIWERLARADMEAVEVLVGELERLAREGGFRLRPPGHTK